MKKLIPVGIVAYFIIQLPVFSLGILLPKRPELPALQIKQQRINITIKDGVAETTVEQIFVNKQSYDLEAIYIFPLPANAAVKDFAMMVNGKLTKAELLEKGKARKIYEDIVRRMKDPGLLEYMDGRLFKLSVYPIPPHGEQKIELTYSQTLDYDAGLFKFIYPLRSNQETIKTIKDFTVKADITSNIPIKNIYSPTHNISINRKDNNNVTIGFEENHSRLNRDFILYYGVNRKEFGVNLLTQRINQKDGYFMMMLAPGADKSMKKAMDKDITFVIDTSGSMAGKKMEQAKNALSYCINSLNKGDRFNIIRFSTNIESFNEQLVDANKKHRKQALKFIKDLQARGGTAINDALLTALKQKRDKTRPHLIAFITDGLPTIGVTNIQEIVKNCQSTIKKDKQNGVPRIFAFGVGENVNTHLLDTISGKSGGTAQYVSLKENIEVAVSSFYDKVSHPVLVSPKITINNIKICDCYPNKLPDMFFGGQITMFGRYKQAGHTAITLTGMINGIEKTFMFEKDFADKNSDNSFIPHLWATRKVGYLLDEIRLNGESKELKEEVIKLSKEFGIVTPYTSYLVVEDNLPPSHPRPPRPIHPPHPMPYPMRRNQPLGRPVIMFTEKQNSAYHASSKMKLSSGSDAIQLSKDISSYKKEKINNQSTAYIKQLDGHTFHYQNNVWIDDKYNKKMKTITLKYASKEYFDYLQKNPKLKKLFSIGLKLIICIDDKIAVIVK